MTTLRESLKYTPVELSFGTSGLRGLVSDMTDLECYINTLGFIYFLKKHHGLNDGSNIYIAGDLRDSTPRIMRAACKAITDGGCVPKNCGFIPTPALIHYAMEQKSPSVMVTGSHIPADRNGVKFNRPDGEVLKEDEQDIHRCVAEVRSQIYEVTVDESIFDTTGTLKISIDLPEVTDSAETMYFERYINAFPGQPLKGKRIVFYQHSSVGRDLFVRLLSALGAEVIPVDRSDVFIPIDTENITPKDQEYFHSLAQKYPGIFAIVSTDGDSDRPFVIDENGIFHRGDVLGAAVTSWLDVDFAAITVSSSDAVDQILTEEHVEFVHTRIGSPYLVTAMQKAMQQGKKKVVGWEVNGGFMLGSTIALNSTQITALPTRDTAFPIISVLLSAIQKNLSLSQLFTSFPSRFTQAGLVDNFPIETALGILDELSVDSPETYRVLEKYFSADHGFGEVIGINSIDGVRITFNNGDIAHLRSSRNAPQLRIYSVAPTQERADEIVQLAIAEPDGIIRQIEKDM